MHEVAATRCAQARNLVTRVRRVGRASAVQAHRRSADDAGRNNNERAGACRGVGIPDIPRRGPARNRPIAGGQCAVEWHRDARSHQCCRGTEVIGRRSTKPDRAEVLRGASVLGDSDEVGLIDGKVEAHLGPAVRNDACDLCAGIGRRGRASAVDRDKQVLEVVRRIDEQPCRTCEVPE